MRYILLGVFILQCCLLSEVKGCSIFETPFGNVSVEQQIQVGSSFTFKCSLFETATEEFGVTSENLILKHQLHRSRTLRLLNATRIIDKYSVEYTVENSTLGDNGFYSCLVPIPKYEKPQLVCSSLISVGYPPLNATNFNCISYEYANLSCTWSEPSNQIPTTYTLYDYLQGSELLSRKCPVPKRQGCEFRIDTKPVYLQDSKVLNFILVGNNSLGTNKQYFSMNHFEIIKPGLPTFVHFSNVRETSLNINISAPYGMEYTQFIDGLVYSVKYYSISTLLDTIREVSVIALSGNTHIVLENLVPHTVYNFEVRSHVYVPGDKFIWSEVKNATEMTRADVPYLSPEIESSAFDYQTISGNRTISLYWKMVPSQFENGEDFHYIIKYHEHFVPNRLPRQTPKKTNEVVYVGNKTSHSFEHLELGSAYIFNIIAANENGKSSNESAVIIVDKAEKLLAGPKDITAISYGQGVYDVSWKGPSDIDANFTLFWCKALKFSSTRCEGPLQWISIVNKTYYKLHLSQPDTNYQFAVATVYNYQTSGMFWAPCTVIHGIPYKVRKVELIPKTSTSLKVRWSLMCETEKKVVKEYALYYCPYSGNCTYNNAKKCTVNGEGPLGWPHTDILNTTSTEYILKFLKPYTCYFSYMRIRTDAGWGENSDFAFESTMQAAPDDPPTNVHADVHDATIKISFNPPTIPNGKITRYVVYYNKTSDESPYHKEVWVSEDAHGIIPGGVTLDNVFFYTNYSIEVVACVDQACSAPSEAIYVSTGISKPGIVAIPRVEIMEEYINITWDLPILPNGPLDYYEVRLEGNLELMDISYNVTGQTFLVLPRKCNIEDFNETYFRVRGVNLKDGVPLPGDYSGPAKTIICTKDNNFFRVGMIVGGVCVAAVFIALLIYGINYFKKNYAKVTSTKIQLPKGLESPLENPLNSYDNFKSGLKNNHDAGIPNDRDYGRLYSSTSDGDLSHTNGVQNANRGPAGRNHSGESAVSGKCHTSISSANTTKTHNSMDSGAEIESPLSPDSFSSDSGSTNTTPRSFKPDLNIVNEANHLASKDSGLEKDNVTTNLSLQSKCKWFEEWKGNKAPDFNVQYASALPYVGDQNFSGRERGSLSNSEPSMVDSEIGKGAETYIHPGIQPYSKFGIGRSLSHENLLPDNPGYSVFGYTPHDIIPVLSHHQVFSSFVSNQPSSPLHIKKDEILAFKKKSISPPKEAYSKFGMAEPRKNINPFIKFENNLPTLKDGNTPSQRTIPSLDAKIGANAGNVNSAPYVKNLANPSECNGFSTEAAALNLGKDLPLKEDSSSPLTSNDFTACNVANCYDHSDVLPNLGDCFVMLDLSKSMDNEDFGSNSLPEDLTKRILAAPTSSHLLQLSGGGIVFDGAPSFMDIEDCETINIANEQTSDSSFSKGDESDSEHAELVKDRNLDKNTVVGYVMLPNSVSHPSVVPEPNLKNISVESV